VTIGWGPLDTYVSIHLREGGREAIHEVWCRCWVANALALGFCLLSVVGPFLRVSGLLCCRHCDRLAELSELEKLQNYDPVPQSEKKCAKTRLQTSLAWAV